MVIDNSIYPLPPLFDAYDRNEDSIDYACTINYDQNWNN